MRNSKRRAFINLYYVERLIKPTKGWEYGLVPSLLALATERGGLVSEVDPIAGDPWHLKKCEGWAWDAFLVYLTAKGMTVTRTGM